MNNLFIVHPNQKEKNFKVDNMQITSIAAMLSDLKDKIIPYSQTATVNYWIVYPKAIEYKGQKLPIGTRLTTEKPESQYKAFPIEHLNILRKMAYASISKNSKYIEKQDICVSGLTIWLNRLANHSIQAMSLDDISATFDLFFLKVETAFTDLQSIIPEVMNDTLCIENLLKNLAPDQHQEPFSFLGLNNTPLSTLSDLMAGVYPFLFNKRGPLHYCEDILKGLSYYQKNASFVTELIASPYDKKVEKRSLSETPDNIHSFPSEHTLLHIQEIAKKLTNKGARVLKTAYKNAVLKIIQVACISYVLFEFTLMSSIKLENPKKHVISAKSNPTDYDAGTQILTSLIWIIQSGNKALLADYLKTQKIKLFAKKAERSLTEPEKIFLEALKIPVKTDPLAKENNTALTTEPVHQSLMHMIFQGEELLSKHIITPKNIRLDPLLPAGSQSRVFLMTCAHEFFAPRDVLLLNSPRPAPSELDYRLAKKQRFLSQALNSISNTEQSYIEPLDRKQV